MKKTDMLIGAPISKKNMDKSKAWAPAAARAVETVIPGMKKFRLKLLAISDRESKRYVAKFMLMTTEQVDTGARILVGNSVKTAGVLKAALPPKPRRLRVDGRRRPIQVKITCRECGKSRKVYGLNNSKQVPRCEKCQEQYKVDRHLRRMKMKRTVAKIEAFDGEVLQKARGKLRPVDNKKVFWADDNAMTNANLLREYGRKVWPRLSSLTIIMEKVTKRYIQFKEEKAQWLDLTV